MTDSGRTDSGDHYFTASPASPDERRPLDVTLAGRRVTVEVAPGIFSPGGVDKGTAVLFDEVPDPPPSGRFLDLGCGWGPIALTLGLLSEHADVLGVDVNERSVDLLARNAQALGLDHVRAVTPDAVAGRRGIRPHLVEPADPHRQGRAARPAAPVAAPARPRRHGLPRRPAQPRLGQPPALDRGGAPYAVCPPRVRQGLPRPAGGRGQPS